MYFLTTLTLSWLLVIMEVRGHGYFVEPPSRYTMSRSNNEQQHQRGLNCGGRGVQYNLVNKGRCGICGDQWSGVRNNEAGGRYAKGIISRTYQQGQDIHVQVEITAPHGGFSEFRLCPNNNIHKPANQSCLDNYLLATPSGETRLMHKNLPGPLQMTLRLPRDLVCTQCVVQWRWTTDNNDNCKVSTPQFCNCVGCGPQEHFYGCADVAILPGNSHGQLPVSTIQIKPEVTQPAPIGTIPTGFIPIATIPSGFIPIQGNKCTATPEAVRIYGNDAYRADVYCQTQCPRGNCSIYLCTKACRQYYD